MGHLGRARTLRTSGIFLAALVIAAGLTVTAPAAHAQTSCGPPGFITDAQDANLFWQCGASGFPLKFSCPIGLVWDPVADACEAPGSIPGFGALGWPTSLSAGTATLQLLPLQVNGLSAALTAGNSKEPVVDATITFTDATGQTLCTARTDFRGYASCDATSLTGDVETLLLGYTARFVQADQSPDCGKGIDPCYTLAPSNGTGTVQLPVSG